MALSSQDRVLIGASFGTAVVGIALIAVGFFLRFGRGFGTFVTYAQKDNDFLELKRLDMVFGLFVAAACLLVLTFLLVTYATIKENRFLLWVINQLSSDDILYESLGKVIDRMGTSTKVPNDDESQFWSHTQQAGCEKEMRSRINTDAQYLGAASMAVLVVEIIASFLAGYRAYALAHPEDYAM